MPVFCGRVGEAAPTPLVAAAKALINVLDEVDQYPALYLNQRILRNAISRYEHMWVPLLARAPPSERITLVPPLDVEWVWFCHMLCPVQYITDSAAMWNAVCPDDHGTIIDHKFVRGAKRKKGKERASALWSDMFPQEPFDVLQSLEDAPIREREAREADSETIEQENEPVRQSRISYDIVAAAERQMAFHYQVAVMPQYRDNRFMRHAVDRYYHKFLTLHRRFPGELWVPTYDIDVIWHAHMMHPRWYRQITEKLLGSVLPHDDTMNDRSPGSQLEVRWNATSRKWNEIFRRPVIREGGMWRGDVEADERIQRPYVTKLIERVTEQAQTILENHTFTSQGTGVPITVEYRVSYGGDVNWPKTTGWVHMTAWRSANHDRRTSIPGAEEKVERLTFLKHSSRVILLTCRTLHFLTYTRSGVPSDFRTILEVFGSSSNIPVATAHYVPQQSVCETYSRSWTSCRRLPGEIMLLLRVGGEDFGLLGGTWTGFEAPVKGTDDSLGSRGFRGSLRLRLWLLGSKRILPLAADKWQSKRGWRHSKVPQQYSFTLPVLDAGRIARASKVKFDLRTGVVQVRHAAHVVPAYLLSMASAALHVTLQPRFIPERGVSLQCTGTMYPEWTASQHPYMMLRGAGGEHEVERCNRGLSSMLYQTMQSNPQWRKFFSGSVSAIRAPAGAVPGGCGGCGGRCASCG